MSDRQRLEETLSRAEEISSVWDLWVSKARSSMSQLELLLTQKVERLRKRVAELESYVRQLEEGVLFGGVDEDLPESEQNKELRKHVVVLEAEIKKQIYYTDRVRERAREDGRAEGYAACQTDVVATLEAMTNGHVPGDGRAKIRFATNMIKRGEHVDAAKTAHLVDGNSDQQREGE